MTRFAKNLTLALAPLVFSGVMAAQSTTTLSVTVGPEASLTVNTGTTTLSTAASNFSLPYTGTTSLSYKIRTTKTGGTGTITLKVTADFAGTGGPSVANPPTAGDALTYTNTVSSPGTAATGSQTASTSAFTNIGSFGADAHSSVGTGSVAWSLTDDPAYATGTYTATVTFAISAT